MEALTNAKNALKDTAAGEAVKLYVPACKPLVNCCGVGCEGDEYPGQDQLSDPGGQA
eukprot:CAMPEP_0195051642 /NCGR_PEP_ID=MMETSP0448-20130528/1168_1 /TAXON_ID=66468 /ORGANISM="Heterocapsa triquestra, Strain CCMP 448" /LENGTH=56 /DNA_ID=CAMNT_0040080675 /DNA_START=72 /DNA_END=242 /DNA_ORIENTATION=+